jgi:tetratricopeptide (TPR) repeat protein
VKPSAVASGLELRLPAAALKLWIDGPATLVDRVSDLLAQGTHLVAGDPGLWAVVPGPGHPEVFDRMYERAQRVLSALGAEIGRGRARALVLPTVVAAGGDGARLVEEPLLEEIQSQAPRLAPDIVHLTTHAALALERRFTLVPAAQLESRSGRVVPLVTVGPPDPNVPPWRNPSVLGRTTRWIPREEPAARLLELARLPAARILGPLGVGKTRLVREVLDAAGHATLWRGSSTAGKPRRPLSDALAGERRRPLWVIYDGLESAPAAVWDEIGSVLRLRDLGGGLHVLLVGRLGAPWSPAAAELPELRVGALEGEEWDQCCAQVFHGLSLPSPVAGRLVEGAAGCPFALEESLVHLVRNRQLRQVFGSFFFGGNETEARFEPSPRLRLHVEAEAARLGETTPLRLVGLLEEPVPATELRAAAMALEASTVPTDWSDRFLAAELVESALGPWGEGLRPRVPAVSRSLAAALTEESVQRARATLGELLAARSGSSEELWQSWRLVAGTEEGARTALAAVRGRGPTGREEQFTALRSELAALAERGGNRELELELLWALLPIARRLGRLHELERAIDRGLSLAEDRPERFVAIAAVAAELAQKEGRLREAETVLRRALAAGRDIEERRKELLLLELGRVLVLLGRKDEARDLFEKTREIAERAGRTGIAAQCLFLLANVRFHDLDFGAARELHGRALELRRAAGLVAASSASLAALGAVAFAEGNFPEAIRLYEEARAVIEEGGAETEESWALLGLGRALGRLGDPAAALPVLRRALQLREGRDDSRGEGIARAAVAETLLQLGHLEDAHAAARKAHFALALLPESEARAEAERVLGAVLLRQRRPAEASTHFAEAERLFRVVGNDLALPEVLAAKLEAALVIGHADAVRAAWKALADERQRRPASASAAISDFQLFRGAEWLRQTGEKMDDPTPFLSRAYSELMRETGFLDAGLRQRFLFQVPAHQAIVDAATQRGLGLPA